VSLHICITSDGMEILCLCVRGQDHTEAEFDIPVEGSVREDE
jgi:hypothetical protein